MLGEVVLLRLCLIPGVQAFLVCGLGTRECSELIKFARCVYLC